MRSVGAGYSAQQAVLTPLLGLLMVVYIAKQEMAIPRNVGDAITYSETGRATGKIVVSRMNARRQYS